MIYFPKILPEHLWSIMLQESFVNHFANKNNWFEYFSNFKKMMALNSKKLVNYILYV